MNCPLEVKNLFVTSTNRDITKNPYGNSYTLYLTNPIKDITNVELLYATVPNTMYNLTNGAQVINFNTIGVAAQTYNLSPGFYGATGLATEIQNTEFTTNGITVTYLPNEGKYLFTSDVSFIMSVLSDELAKLLGFTGPISTNPTAGSYYQGNPVYKNYYAKSDTLADLNTHDGVFLDIEELRTIFNECAAQGQPYNTNSQTASRSFGIIPMDVSSGCIKRFTKNTDYDNNIEYMYPIKRLDRVTINWTDKNGQLLNFNGYNDNSFLLRFHTLRRNLC